jgi:tetratricopeptide (TPR) repeat protein
LIGSLRWTALATSLLVLLQGGCAVLSGTAEPTPLSELLPLSVELAAVPFFAQEVHECGPAALAEILIRAGVETSPEALADEVYLPGRQGSLSTEIVASVRHHGRLPERLPARLSAVFNAVAAGRPVLVLQNLGLEMLPRWHYAVVIGYDLGRREVLLRSGLEARQAMPIFTFEQTWLRGGGFALTALRPGEMPLATGVESWLRTLAQSGAPLVAWEAAVRRWPGSAAAGFGLANARLAQAEPDLPGAERALRAALSAEPDFLPGYNNLALVLARQGNWAEARKWLDLGIVRLDAAKADPQVSVLRAQFEDTRKQVLAGRINPPAGR